MPLDRLEVVEPDLSSEPEPEHCDVCLVLCLVYGEGGGCPTGAKSTFAVLRALAGAV